MFSQICLLDDLFRDGFLESRKFIYSIIKEPIYQATGLVIPDLSEFPVCRGLKKEFSLGLFYSLCGNKSWHEVYNGVSEKAAEYLSESIPENTLIIGYEMPPWLLKLLSDNDLPYVSIRISPIKFCRDLYLVLDGNIETLKNAKYFNVDEKEVRLEAGVFSAAVQQRKLPRKKSEYIKNSVVFIGQTENDASLIDEAGRILKVDCFLEDIERIVGSRNLIYKPHPYDMRFAKKEYRALKRHTRLSTQIIKGDTYSLLASDLSFETLTISSGTCQEALFFNKKPFYLFKPICNPWDHLHVRFLDFCSPAFWAECLGYKSSKNLITMSYHPDNVMRRFHDVWWGYSDFMINNDQFWLHAYKTSRKNEILRYIDSLKKNLIKLLRP